MKKDDENSLQTATRWAGNGVKLVYAGYAAHSLLFPAQPEPKASKAARLDALEENAEKLDELLAQRKQLQEVVKEALVVTLADDEDAYVASAEFIAQKSDELRGEAYWLIREDYFPGASKAKCKKLEIEMRDLSYVWANILSVRKHQAFLAEEAYLVKIGAKSAFASWHEKSCYRMNSAMAAVAWTVLLVGGVAFTAAVIYHIITVGLPNAY